MTNPSRRRVLTQALGCAGLPALGLLGGCNALLPKPPPAPALFSIDGGNLAASAPAIRPPPPNAPTLIVGTPRAAPGFDTPRIVYVRHAHELEAFAYSQWVQPPALMLAPLIAKAAERSGAFRAVLLAPTVAVAELRLDTELVRLQHEFADPPSRVRLTLRAVLVETATRRVVAWREFDTSAPAASDDPYGGVVAANQAVNEVLADLAAFCAQAASQAAAPR